MNDPSTAAAVGPVAVTQSTFAATVIESDKLVIVDFWAPWCGPCRKLGPVLDELATEYADQVTIAKVNVDEERVLGATYQIMSIPAVKFFKDGHEVDEFVGLKPKADIVKRITALL